MSIQPIKIPQNVYVEDRIIGPVTLRQIIVTGIGAGISYLLYSAFIRSGLSSMPFQIAAWIPAVIGAAFAFLKINDLSLLSIILLIAEGMNKPHERVWTAHPGLSIVLVTRQNERRQQTASASSDAATLSRLADVARALEKRQQELDALAQRSIPRPEQTEAVRTHLDGIIATDEHVHSPLSVRTQPAETSDDTSSTTHTIVPVQRDKIRASPFDPSYAIDTIHLRLPSLQDHQHHALI